MKKIISSLFKIFGLSVSKSPKSGFEYLLNRSRFNIDEINLLGEKFEIADSHSFYYSHKEIFIDEIYKFQCEKNDPIILDCGSNYGTSIVYFKQLYPDAKIIGVEADPKIFKILKKNIHQRNFKNVTLINKAMSNKNGPIQFYSEGADGGRVHALSESIGTHEVETLSLDDIVEGEIDFLKMDIEGAETDVLVTSKKLDQVKQLFIEYHSFVDETQKLGELLSCLTQNKFRYYIHTQFCTKQPLIKNEIQLGMDLQLNILAKKI